MLIKFLMFLVIFTISIFVMKFISNILIAGFIIAFLTVFIFYFLIKKDAKRLKFQIENLKNPSFTQSDEAMFFDENLSLQNSLSELSSDIREVSKKYIKKSAKIKLRNTQLQGILSSISHEFKNPVAVIQASSHTLMNDKNLSDELRSKFIEKITKNSQRIVNLIDRLNLRSADSLSLKKTNFNLYNLALGAKNELLEKYKDREIDIENNEIQIFADEALIKQVLVNLIENALKYSNDKIEICFHDSSILIKDRGAGIEQKDIRLITKKYFKVKNNIQTNSFGLGLYISKQILKMHGFEFIIRSELNKGSVFGFRYLTDSANKEDDE
ncbi:sensor histidine kinase [Campylobacter sp. RM16192]|uniref:sensor histidine kinase n=1 Tax=Campylobacter sp. RM16192 TaxID=1660080 RepID=UPI0014513819|nr:HAMP domain-containing sensor histidine kinase [Campylobacter sp. RM16192]QCD52009.1 two-component system sensor histidine kinase [Campylobacter sp. RM16192]